MTPTTSEPEKKFEVGKKYIIDNQYVNSGEVTLIKIYGEHYCRVGADGSEWDTMLNRLSEIKPMTEPKTAEQEIIEAIEQNKKLLANDFGQMDNQYSFARGKEVGFSYALSCVRSETSQLQEQLKEQRELIAELCYRAGWLIECDDVKSSYPHTCEQIESLLEKSKRTIEQKP